MFIANLMFENVDCTYGSLRTSGSENSEGPWNVSPVQLVPPPTKPSKPEPTEKLRLRSTPQLLRAYGSFVARRVRRAVVDHVLALRVVVVHRVRGAVGVDRRDDEDVEVVDQRLRLGIGRVVAHEPLGGLEADAAGAPLAGVLLAVDEDADLRALRLADVVADAEHLHRLRAARVARRGVAASR